MRNVKNTCYRRHVQGESAARGTSFGLARSRHAVWRAILGTRRDGRIAAILGGTGTEDKPPGGGTASAEDRREMKGEPVEQRTERLVGRSVLYSTGSIERRGCRVEACKRGSVEAFRRCGTASPPSLTSKITHQKSQIEPYILSPIRR